MRTVMQPARAPESAPTQSIVRHAIDRDIPRTFGKGVLQHPEHLGHQRMADDILVFKSDHRDAGQGSRDGRRPGARPESSGRRSELLRVAGDHHGRFPAEPGQQHLDSGRRCSSAPRR